MSGLAGRLWTYQQERFPLLQHGPAVALFAVSGVLLAARVGGGPIPSAWTFVVAVALCLIVFLQLRIADEFKDADDDRRFRPERPVPRGLVSLRQLLAVGAAAGVLALALAFSLSPLVAVLLLLVWAWGGLMTIEFGLGDWLRQRPVLYLVSHMAIMPLIAVLATGCVWAAQGLTPPPGTAAFVALAFANGCVLEIGRKVWAPEEERDGVETYSRLWGPQRAAGAWLVTVGTASVFSALSLIQVAARPPMLAETAQLVLAAVLAAALIAAAVAALSFRRRPSRGRRKWLGAAAAGWVLASYLVLSAAVLLAPAQP